MAGPITLADLNVANIGMPRPQPRPAGLAAPAAAVPQSGGASSAPTAQPQAQAPQAGFLGGLFSDPDRRARLAMALEGMTMHPNQALIGNLQQGIADRKATTANNKTVTWLKQLGTPQALKAAEALASGAIDAGTAVQFALKKPDVTNGVAVNGKLVNPETGAVIYDGGADPKEAFGHETDLMKMYKTEPDVVAFEGVRNAYGRMRGAYTTILAHPEAAGAGDLAIIFSYMKMLDPNSVVREGEQAQASQTSGVPDQIRNLYNAVASGSKLTDGQRLSFLTQGESMFQSTAQNLGAVNEKYGSTAKRYQVDPGFMLSVPSYHAIGMAGPPPPGSAGSNGGSGVTTSALPPIGQSTQIGGATITRVR